MNSSMSRFRLEKSSPPPETPDTRSPPAADTISALSPPPDNDKASRPGLAEPPSSGSARSGLIPPCERCRRFKKKCSRTLPICALCRHAGKKCSFATSTGPSPSTQVSRLQARVEWLSRIVSESLPDGASIETIRTGASLTRLVQHSPPSVVDQTNGLSPSATASGLPMHLDRHPLNGLEKNGRDNNEPAATSPARISAAGSLVDLFTASSNEASRNGLPEGGLERLFVNAFFRNVNRAYPFIDRNKVLDDLEHLQELSARPRDVESTLLYLIMAIGCTTLERAGQIPPDSSSKFVVAYPDIVKECLCRETVESVQILVLLALYSLFDPFASPSTFSIVGIASRQALAIGLTRRVADDGTPVSSETERNHRLYWSIYVLDRMMSTSVGLPVALTDDSADVPLPGLTIDEFTSPERPQFALMLQTSRHVIQLRLVEDRILRVIRLRKQAELGTIPAMERRAILQDIRAEIENWYSSGCLISPSEPDNLPIHNSVTWLSARYYFLLLLLYYPSHFSTGVITPYELLRLAQKHIQSTAALFQQRQLPLNRVTLSRLFPVVMILVHCAIFHVCEGSDFPAREETMMVVNILESFADGWIHAKQTATLVRRLVETIGSAQSFEPPRTALQRDATSELGLHGLLGSTERGAFTRRRLLRLEEIQQDLKSVMLKSLGPATCFQSMEPAKVERSLNDMVATNQRNQQTQLWDFDPQLHGHSRRDTEEGLSRRSVDDGTDMISRGSRVEMSFMYT